MRLFLKKHAAQCYFSEGIEKRFRKNIQESTALPTRAVAHAPTTLLAAEFIQRSGQDSSTYYQLVF